jgi:general secretion pathway protein C
MTPKLKYLLFFLLVTLAAYAGSTLLLSYLEHEVLNDVPSPASEESRVYSEAVQPSSPVESSKALARRSLPPERKEDKSEKASRVEAKPARSSWNLKLLGTVVNEKGPSWAIIMDLDRDLQDMVSVGSMVAGARVVSIEKDKVTLSINGREEVLLLGAERDRTASTHSPQAPGESATSTYVVDRQTVQENLDNLPSLLMQARAEIFFKEGKAEGFQLSQIQKGSLLKSVGFQDGDVIQSVNGKEVRSLEDAITLYQQLGDRDSYKIGILRGDKPKTLHVKIK